MARERDTGQKDFSHLAWSLVGHMTDDEGAVTKALTAAERAAIARPGGQARWA